MDKLTKGIQDEILWCMLFVNDIVPIYETREGVNTKLERWRGSLEAKGFRLIGRKPNTYIADLVRVKVCCRRRSYPGCSGTNVRKVQIPRIDHSSIWGNW